MPKTTKTTKTTDTGWEELKAHFQPYNTDPKTISLFGNHRHLAFHWDYIQAIFDYVPKRIILAEALGEELNHLEQFALTILAAHAESRGWVNPRKGKGK